MGCRERRGKWERHKELVGTGTNLVNEARNNNWRLGMVTGDQRFSELRPHLSATTLALFDAATPFFTAEGRVRQQEPNAVVEHPSMKLAPKLPPENRDAKQALTALRVELDRLEKKWDLV